jgi:lysophospholipase L1-like esterase
MRAGLLGLALLRCSLEAPRIAPVAGVVVAEGAAQGSPAASSMSGSAAPNDSSASPSTGSDPELQVQPSALEPHSMADRADEGSGRDAGAGTPASEPDAARPVAAQPIVYLAGDSTVSTYADTPSPNDQAGWGQMLSERFDASVRIDNRAIGGRTARHFIEEGRLAEIAAALAPGDYLFVQFGTNDGNRTATYDLGGATIPYYLDPETDFKLYLSQYLDAARGAGSTPVLVTPPPRNSAYCTGGNGTGAYAQAMRELGRDEGVPVVDLNAKAVAYLTQACPAPVPEDFFLLRADGSVDGTHFQERGARILAGFVAEGIAEAGLPLAAHRLSQ